MAPPRVRERRLDLGSENIRIATVRAEDVIASSLLGELPRVLRSAAHREDRQLRDGLVCADRRHQHQRVDIGQIEVQDDGAERLLSEQPEGVFEVVDDHRPQPPDGKRRGRRVGRIGENQDREWAGFGAHAGHAR